MIAACCVFICLCQLLLTVNDLPQIPQWNGFSPVCVLICLRRSDLWLDSFLQMLHLYTVSPASFLLTTICFSSWSGAWWYLSWPPYNVSNRFPVSRSKVFLSYVPKACHLCRGNKYLMRIILPQSTSTLKKTYNLWLFCPSLLISLSSSLSLLSCILVMITSILHWC